MKYFLRGLWVAFILGATLGRATAADLPLPVAPPVPQILEDGYQPFALRLGMTGVLPSTGGSLATTGGATLSNGFKATNTVIPEVDVGYYFTKHIAAQLICCLSPHNVFINGGDLNGTQATRALLFPPTLLLQYHFTDFGPFQPYVGAGVNYTHYFGLSRNNALLSYVAAHDSWGVAAQAGIDYALDAHWALNIDAKWIMMNPGVRANTVGGVGLVGRADLDPVMVGAGLVYRFGGAAPTPVVARY